MVKEVYRRKTESDLKRYMTGKMDDSSVTILEVEYKRTDGEIKGQERFKS